MPNEHKTNQLTLANRYDKYLTIYNDTRPKIMEVTFNQSRSDNQPNNSIQMLSEISVV